jgi:large subunit ribosomal protein L19
MNLIHSIEEAHLKKQVPAFKAGDTLRVQIKVVEISKDGKPRERLQAFEGVCIERKHSGINETFTLRKISHGVGVERTLLIHSPMIDSIDVVRRGDVRKAKLFYLRTKIGKAAKVKEKKFAQVQDQ